VGVYFHIDGDAVRPDIVPRVLALLGGIRLEPLSLLHRMILLPNGVAIRFRSSASQLEIR
jgi:hypothetical protein